MTSDPSLEAKQLALLDGSEAARAQKQASQFPNLSPHIKTKFAARRAIDFGAGGALLIAAGHGFSAIGEIFRPPHFRPLVSGDPQVLASIDGTLALVALALAAAIWWLEAEWATAILFVWAIFEASYIGPHAVYGHADTGKIFYFPYAALIAAANAWLGSRALKSNLPEYSWSAASD